MSLLKNSLLDAIILAHDFLIEKRYCHCFEIYSIFGYLGGMLEDKWSQKGSKLPTLLKHKYVILQTWNLESFKLWEVCKLITNIWDNIEKNGIKYQKLPLVIVRRKINMWSWYFSNLSVMLSKCWEILLDFAREKDKFWQ